MRPPTVAPAAIPPFAPAERPLDPAIDDDEGEDGGDEDEAELVPQFVVAEGGAPPQKNVPPTLDSLDSLWRGVQSSGKELLTNTSPAIFERAGKLEMLIAIISWAREDPKYI